MPVRMRARNVLLLLAVARLGAAGEDPADALYAKYRELETSSDVPARRFEALRAIAKPRTERAREILLKIARSGRTPDDRIVALCCLGPLADLATAEQMIRCVEVKRDPVFVEALGDALAESTDPEVAKWIIAEGITATKTEVLLPSMRAAGLLALHDAEPVLMAVYGKAAASVNTIDVATEALQALGRVGGAASLPLLLAAAKHADFRHRLSAADALAKRTPADELTLRALTELLNDTDDVVRLVAAIEIGRSKIEPLVPELIARLEGDPRLRTRRVAYEALKAISGRDYHYDPGAWRTWWKQRDTPEGAGGESFTFARYFGHPVMSDRAVFLVDLSGSMRWNAQNPPSRIEIARKEMLAALAALPKGCVFNIVVYSDRVRAWQRSEVQATPENVSRAVAFVEKTFEDPQGDTHTYDALKQVFGHNSKFDTVYFVSDGIPSEGAFISHEGILANVRIWNRYRRAVIDTVALTLDRGLPNLAPKYKDEKDFMTRMAESTGGECRIIASPFSK